ncbi:hypothetical protein HDV06_006266 [Boothiomyces sp. JEL0866]|nr:hypothetical protein HDV06_006266 [Boothiomyces sp. JEL0866]
MSLASYDQYLVEDPTVNMMLDSLVLFDQIVNHPTLKTQNFLLFLNKKDIYEKKIKKVLLSKYFPDYTEMESYEIASKAQALFRVAGCV